MWDPQRSTAVCPSLSGWCLTQVLTQVRLPEKPARVVSHFSCVRLSATPWMVAHQDAASMGILQARILERVAISSSRGSSRPRDQTWVC